MKLAALLAGKHSVNILSQGGKHCNGLLYQRMNEALTGVELSGKTWECLALQFGNSSCALYSEMTSAC